MAELLIANSVNNHCRDSFLNYSSFTADICYSCLVARRYKLYAGEYCCFDN